MTLLRSTVLALVWALAFSSGVRAQADPLQDANNLYRQGQFDRAMERVNSYLATRPKDARGRFLKGVILSEQNKPNEAIKVFAELSQDYPELPEPYNNLAVLYASQGAYDKAKSALETAIRTHPSYATAHENLGDIYAKMASQAYDKALQLDRSNQAAQSKLNLIKDLFSQGTRTPTKVAATKPESTPSPAASVTPAAPSPSASAPPAAPPSPPAKTAAATPAPAPAAQPSSESAPAAPPSPPAKTATSPLPPAGAPAAKSAPAAPASTSPSETQVALAKPSAADQKTKAATDGGPDDVLRSVAGWARAWESNDVPGYLAHYAPDFQPPNRMSRGAWEAERRSRIAKPRKIEVEVISPKVTFDQKNRAIVTFKQHYRSGSLNVSGNKTLVLVKNGDKWQIQQERAGG
jgi:tetratricopeptide (TPR) repeat protein